MADSNWTNLPWCVLTDITCDSPPVKSEETIIRGGDRWAFFAGNTVEVGCRDGHQGKTARWTCLKSGEWRQPSPRCKPLTCSVPPQTNKRNKLVSVEHGKLGTNTVGTFATYSCQEGYRPLTGSAEWKYVCQADGRMSGASPKCVGKAVHIDHLDTVIALVIGLHA